MRGITKDILAAMRRLGVTITYRDGEYRVNYLAGKEATAYYTNDGEDAVLTAQDYAWRKHKRPESLIRNPKRKHRVRKAPKRDYKSVKRFTKKANTPKKRRQWKHVYRTERKRGLGKVRSIRAADNVIRRETLKRNPLKHWIIEALVDGQRQRAPLFRYWEDAKHRFVVRRELATEYGSKQLAYKEAKHLLTMISDRVTALRVVPA